MNFFRPSIGLREHFAIHSVLASRQLTQGERVGEFERGLEEFLHVNHAVAANSGTSALILSLLGLGIGPGDEVIVPAFTFVATANAVSVIGATPVIVDIEPEYYGISVSEVERAINSRTKAVIAVHLFGQSAEISEIKSLADEHGIFVVEDVAQALGATHDGSQLGTFGDSAALSFFPSKNITTGEGGAALFQKDNFAQKARDLRNQGQRGTYEYVIPGYNFRLSELHAAIGLIQLDRISKLLEKRKRNAEIYNSILPQSIIPKVRPKSTHTYNQYVIQVKEKIRGDLVGKLNQLGVPTRIYYPKALNQYEMMAGAKTKVAEDVAKRVLAIPVGPNFSKKQILEFVSLINKALQEIEPN